MSTPSLAFSTIEELAPLLAKKKLSPVELLRTHLDRIERLNPKTRAFITVMEDRALGDARRAERELLHGRRRGKLHGIPVALKDNIYTRGVRTTAGAAILRDFAPEEDATVVRRLRQAGAVIIGKTNLHEFAYGISSENPHFGVVHNPWALDRISGGSSGGAAVAVSAGMCTASVGTDTGGSVRIPSSLCGVVGLKPTFGRVSVHGVLPLAPSFDHVGVLTRSTGDAALLLEALAGRDPLDPTTIARPAEAFAAKARRPVRKLRLGRPAEHFWNQLDPEVQALAESALTDLRKQPGTKVVQVDLPTLSSGVDAANTVAFVEATRTHTQAGWFPTRSAEYGADVLSRLEQGRTITAVDFLEAIDTVRRARAEFEAAFENVDAVVAPTTAIPAPLIGSEMVAVGDVQENVRSALVRLNRPANFTGLPAISIPCGFTKMGLPVGLQIIGRRFGESELLAIAHLYERSHEWCSKHPSLD